MTDGDTVKVRTKGKRHDVRLIGIDTPEVSEAASAAGARRRLR